MGAITGDAMNVVHESNLPRSAVGLLGLSVMLTLVSLGATGCTDGQTSSGQQLTIICAIDADCPSEQTCNLGKCGAPSGGIPGSSGGSSSSL